MIAITDYGMGNLRSVSKAFEYIGAHVFITNSPKEILKADALVVPGVGAFGDCIRNLGRLGLLDTIKNFILSGRLYLGLCLGMQILFNESEEAPGISGLGIFSGVVKKFPISLGLKIPHIGWNQIKKVSGVPETASSCGASKPQVSNPLLLGISDNSYMYFVHSYYVELLDKTIVACETEYGIRFCSMIWKDNIWATQFHPEKSQRLGLRILENFVKLCK